MRYLRYTILFIAVPVAVCLVASLSCIDSLFHVVPSAYATGGAFKDTKHGGGTVDGIDFQGVDRSVNPDYGSYYNDLTGEGGRYKPGECVHCHEVHASFGESEPPPASGSVWDPDGGPNPYLGLAGADQNFCFYCHESINFDPVFGGGTGYWRFFQGKARYLESGHYNSTVMKNPGYGVGSPWPRTDRTGNLLSGHCLQCHTPHGLRGSYDTGTAPSTSNLYVSSTVDNGLLPRQLIAREEALCLNCHDGSPASKDVKTWIDKPLAGAYGHPVRKDSYYGRHDLASESPILLAEGWLDNNPHTECTDCHNPHVAGKGPGDTAKAYSHQDEQVAYNTNRGGTNTASGPVRISNVNRGVWGVSVTTSTGAVSCCIDSLEPDTNYVYELCLKCHSQFGLGTSTTLTSSSAVDAAYPTTGTPTGQTPYVANRQRLTDVAAEFATDNYGYHPVFAKGKNQPPCNANPNWPGGGAAGQGDTGSGADAATGGCGLSNNFVAPWRHDSYVTCIDCHTTPSGDPNTTAIGPHGSSNRWMLKDVDRSITITYVGGGGYSYSTGNAETVAVSPTEKTFCFNCHRADVYGPLDQGTDGGGGGGMGGGGMGATPPTKANYARQPHVSSYDYRPWSSSWLPKQGIHCMHCHGGGTAGGLHGSRWGKNPWGYSGATGAKSYSGRRLLNGATWIAVTRGSTTQAGACWTEGSITGMSSCTRHNTGRTMNKYSTYDYESGADP
ncbi:MAG TPA: hypothetical protein ENJ37_05790 [Deltaproteobacteria bacterium]|nr:hypothetical protein [Deltaproteobacteria bacterium]